MHLEGAGKRRWGLASQPAGQRDAQEDDRMVGSGSARLPLDMYRSSYAGDRVATDPDVIPSLADMDPATPAQDGSLSSDVGARGLTRSDQPLAE